MAFFFAVRTGLHLAGGERLAFRSFRAAQPLFLLTWYGGTVLYYWHFHLDNSTESQRIWI